MKKIFLLLLTALTSGCNGLFYYPSSTMVRTPADVGIAYEQLVLRTENEPDLAGWFLPTEGEAKGTILFLHGNAENISTHFSNVYWLPKRGYQVFIFDYAGYGESDGTATLSGIHSDIARMIRFVLEHPKVKPGSIFLVGQSLGGSMALYTAAQPEFRHTFESVVVEAPFSSYRQIARDKLALFWLTYPLQWPLAHLVSDEFSPEAVVQNIKVPVLILHGTRDVTVPPDHSVRLCSLLGDRCVRWEIEDAVHGQPFFVEDVRERLVKYLDQAVALSGGR